MSALAMGSYRHDRREGRTLEQIHTNLDEVIAAHCPPPTFATGQLAQIDVDTGTMTWTNAGHPLPLLIRDGQVTRELKCEPTLPWGIASALERTAAPSVATDTLQPGDSVLLFTDGVIEAHEPGGDQFGLDCLVDIAGQHTSDLLEPEEIVRQIVRSVLEYQADQLDDDATLVLIRWNGPAEGTSD